MFRLKLIKLVLVVGLIIKTAFGSINSNAGRLPSQILNTSYPINPLNNSDRFFVFSNISFTSIPELKDHKYYPNIGFGYKISKNLALEGTIFNKPLGNSYHQVIDGGVQYFFGGTDTLSWASSIKKSSYNSMKIYSLSSITFDISKWVKFKNKFFKFGFGSFFYKKSEFSNNLNDQINFAFMNILAPVRLFQIGLELKMSQYSSLISLLIQKDFH